MIFLKVTRSVSIISPTEEQFFTERTDDYQQTGQYHSLTLLGNHITHVIPIMMNRRLPMSKILTHVRYQSSLPKFILIIGGTRKIF